jgi:hypothetical protein
VEFLIHRNPNIYSGNKIKNTTSTWLQYNQLDDLEKVKILNESGASLYFRAPEELEDFFV